MVIVYIHIVVTKRPKVQGRGKGGMKWSDVMIFGEMCVLSLIYSYVAVCMLCAVRCVFIICSCLLFSNYSIYVL
jgi:hypothetical protein